jgi:hypothetical protein
VVCHKGCNNGLVPSRQQSIAACTVQLSYLRLYSVGKEGVSENTHADVAVLYCPLRKHFTAWRYLMCLSISLPVFCGSRGSVVGIATAYGMNDRGVGVRAPVGSRIFSSPRRTDRLLGPPKLLSNGYRGLFRGGKAPGSEADHSLPTSAKVKKMWIYTSTPHTSPWRSA